MYYHFQNTKGWMSSPCGLIYYKNRYHLYFQHFPSSPRYGIMHWGHAVSDNLKDWEEKEIALTPDREYEMTGGVRGGSVIEYQGKIYAFYGSDNSISVAVSEDGYSFGKYNNNPVINFDSTPSDPKVFRYNGCFKMLVGTGDDGVGRISLYESKDLLNWEFKSIILENRYLGSNIENPNLFMVEDRWILMFQAAKSMPHRMLFSYVDFDGESITFENEADPFFTIESGADFMSPYVFEDHMDRKILMGWIYSRLMNKESLGQIGLMSAPRELTLDMKDNLIMLPVDELISRTVKESRFVNYDQGRLRIAFEGRTLFSKAYKEMPELLVLEDVGLVEVFVNKGVENITMVIC